MNTVHVHVGLARNSDWAFTSALVVDLLSSATRSTTETSGVGTRIE